MANNSILTRTKPSKPSSWVFRALVYASTVLTVLAVCFIIGYILVMGVPQIKPEMFELTYNSDNCSFMPALFNTLIVIVLSISCSSVFGIGAAIFLNEYTDKGNWFVRVVALATETLSGIPSIVYGLFGLLIFVYYLQWGLSLLAGVCTMAIMTFPIIMRATQEALAAVPDLYREGSFGLGAGRFRTVFRIVLPTAIPGILGGIILAIGRTVGESAAFIRQAQLPQFQFRCSVQPERLLSTCTFWQVRVCISMPPMPRQCCFLFLFCLLTLQPLLLQNESAKEE